MGLAFHGITAAREQGTSLKDTLDLMAQRVQQAPDEGIPLTVRLHMGILVAWNVYANPLYKRFGPEMNKLTAQERCKLIGVVAFLKELETFLHK
jgi:hypothetical protein